MSQTVLQQNLIVETTVDFNSRSNVWIVQKASWFVNFSKNCNPIDPTQSWRALLASFHELESLSCDSDHPMPEFNQGHDCGLQLAFECLERSKMSWFVEFDGWSQ
jgi:hypothetical protein